MRITISLIGNGKTIPQYQTSHSAGMDLCAATTRQTVLWPGEYKIIPTGIAIALPAGYEAQVRARSGLAAKHGIGLVNGIGTIDADYRGEIGAILINNGQEPFAINPGDRVAQLVIAKYEHVKFKQVDTLEETERGSGGFGSTGV
jgi:dUTP pyrophosphatase